MASLKQIASQAPEVVTVAERSAKICAAYPYLSSCDTGSFLDSVFEVVPAEAIQAVFPLVSIPGILPSGVESAARAVTEEVGISRETFSTVKQIAEPLLTSNLLSLETLSNLGGTMSLFDFSDVFSDFSFGDLASQLVSEVGVPLLAQELVPQQNFPAVMVGTQAPVRQPQSIQMATGGAMVPGGGMVGVVSKAGLSILLGKVAAFLGRRGITLNAAASLARKMGTFIKDPAVIAGAMGLVVGELAILLSAHASKRTRRMNPGNVKALRRSMRRVESFHKLCQRADMLRSRGRRTGKKCREGSTQFVRQG